MSKIERLSAEQVDQLRVQRDLWVQKGLNTTPTDRKACELAVKKAYTLAGLNPPSIIVWVQSPAALSIAKTVLSQTGGQVFRQARAQVSDQILVQNQVWDQVSGQVRGQVENQVLDQVENQVWDQVSVQVQNQALDQVRGHVQNLVPINLSGVCYGSQDAGWLSHYKTMQVLGVQNLEQLEGLWDMTECGWWYPMRDMVVLSERPIEIHRDSVHRLHNENGPAVLYPDGFSVWAWHGIRIPSWVIKEPEKINIDTIHAESNAETRRVMVERFGVNRYLLESGATPLDTALDEGGQVMELYDVYGARRLRLRNSTVDPDGTRREYILRVPREMQTVWEARNWTCGLDKDARFNQVS